MITVDGDVRWRTRTVCSGDWISSLAAESGDGGETSYDDGRPPTFSTSCLPIHCSLFTVHNRTETMEGGPKRSRDTKQVLVLVQYLATKIHCVSSISTAVSTNHTPHVSTPRRTGQPDQGNSRGERTE